MDFAGRVSEAWQQLGTPLLGDREAADMFARRADAPDAPVLTVGAWRAIVDDDLGPDQSDFRPEGLPTRRAPNQKGSQPEGLSTRGAPYRGQFCKGSDQMGLAEQ